MFEDLSDEEKEEILAFSLMEHLGQLDDKILNKWEFVLHNLHWCSAIVFADGFEGLLFQSPTDKHILELFAALESFGAKKCTGMFKQALQVFPDANSITQAGKRKVVYAALTPKARQRLKDLSHRFNAAGDREMNQKTLLAYLRLHSDEIRFRIVLDHKRNKFRLTCSDKSIKWKGR